MPADTLVRQYRGAALSWLDNLRSAGLTWPEFDRDRSRAENLSAAQIVAAMAKLGDRMFGWSGQIHPFNFLYAGIGLPRLSLVDVYASAAGDLSAFANEVVRSGQLRIELSQPEITRAGGRVVADFEAIYTNPLAELLERAVEALDQANRAIEDQRTNYLLPLRDEINRIKADLPLSLANVSSSIDRIDRTIQEIVGGRP